MRSVIPQPIASTLVKILDPLLISKMSHPILTSLPRDILQHLANTYLTDVDVNCTARVASIVLRTLNGTIGNQAAAADSSIMNPVATNRTSGYRIKRCLPLSYILSQPYRQASAAGRIIGLPTSVFTSHNDHIGLNRLMSELPLSVKSITFRKSFLGPSSYTRDNSHALPVNIKWPDHLTELLDVAFSTPITQVVLPEQLKRLTFAADAGEYSPDHSFAPIIRGDRDCLPPLKPRVPLGEKSDEIDALSGCPRVKFTLLDSLLLAQDQLISLVDRVWPRSLTYLIIEGNESLEGVTLPHTLLSLQFSGQFSQPLNGFMFPPHLQQLTLIPAVYRHPLNDWTGLPQSCTYLYLSVSTATNTSWDGCDDEWWHMDLSHVAIPDQIEFLTLSFASSEDDVKESMQPSLNRLRFPSKMRELKLNSFNQPLSEFVWNRDESTTRIESVDFIPLSLSLGSSFNGKIEATYFPPNLTSLSLGSSYTGDIKSDKLPHNLVSIYVGRWCKNRSSTISLPPRVESIYFGEWSYLSGFEFPVATRFISLPVAHFRESLARIRFPPSLTELHVDSVHSTRFQIQYFLEPKAGASQLLKLHSITTSDDEYIPIYHHV